MPLQPLYAEPGVQLTNSDYSGGKQAIYANGRMAVGRWTDCNNVEFVAGFPQKIAGYVSTNISSGDMFGTPRSMLTWRDNDGTTRLAIGTESRLYSWDGTTLADITPAVPSVTSSGASTNSLAFTSGSTTITITDTNTAVANANALVVGDHVYVSCDLPGLFLWGWYPVASVSYSAPTLTFTLTAPAAPTGSATYTNANGHPFALGYPRSLISGYALTSGSSTVKITSSVSLGASAIEFANTYGPYVTIAPSITSNGVTIGGTYLATWVDSTHYTITASGTASATTTLSAQSQYQILSPSMDQATYGTTSSPTWTSYMLTGSGNNFSNTSYVSFPDVAAMDFGTGQLTIEAWVYLNTLGVNQTLMDGNTSGGTTAWRVGLDSSNNIFITCSNGTLQAPSGLTTGGWHHVAIVRNSSQTLTIYVDGVFQVSSHDTNNYGFGQGTIGNNVGLTQPFKGMISSLRITNTAVYTSNFTPPSTALTTITGTLLLTARNSTLIDEGPNNITLTAHGSAAMVSAIGNPPGLAISSPPTAYPVQNYPLGWSLAQYGGLLLASPHGGSIYVYDPTVANSVGYRMEGAPQSCAAMFVTPERMVVALGAVNIPTPGGTIANTLSFASPKPCWTPTASGTGTIASAGSPLTAAWSDQSDFTQWFSMTSNTANTGRQLIGYGAYFVGGVAVRDGYSLILTNRACFAMSYSGNQLIYDTPLLADNAGLVSPNAICSTGGTAYWLGDKELWAWSGGVQLMPSDDIRDFFFGDLNTTYQTKCCMAVNRKKKQIRLYYPSGDNTENSAYLIFQTDSQAWSKGDIGRSAWEDARLFTTPVACDSDGNIFFEETGVDADGSALDASITYSPIDISNGSSNVDVFGFIPDFERLTGVINLTVNTKYYPQDPMMENGPYVITAWDTTPEIDLRCDGKMVGFKLDSNTVGGDFRLGLSRIEIQPSGMRN